MVGQGNSEDTLHITQFDDGRNAYRNVIRYSSVYQMMYLRPMCYNPASRDGKQDIVI
jgi:hypothetical protein